MLTAALSAPPRSPISRKAIAREHVEKFGAHTEHSTATAPCERSANEFGLSQHSSERLRVCSTGKGQMRAAEVFSPKVPTKGAGGCCAWSPVALLLPASLFARRRLLRSPFFCSSLVTTAAGAACKGFAQRQDSSSDVPSASPPPRMDAAG